MNCGHFFEHASKSKLARLKGTSIGARLEHVLHEFSNETDISRAKVLEIPENSFRYPKTFLFSGRWLLKSARFRYTKSYKNSSATGSSLTVGLRNHPLFVAKTRCCL